MSLLRMRSRGSVTSPEHSCSDVIGRRLNAADVDGAGSISCNEIMAFQMDCAPLILPSAVGNDGLLECYGRPSTVLLRERNHCFSII